MGGTYRIGNFIKRVGRSVNTVRRWEADGRIAASRLPLGQRTFDDSDVRWALQPSFGNGQR